MLGNVGEPAVDPNFASLVDPSDLSNGKARKISPAPRPVGNLTQCRICFDPCRLTTDPFAAALTRTSSDRVPFGISCGSEGHKHTYCMECMAGYIQSKIEDHTATKVFPLACPEVRFRLSLVDFC